ncbi:hypothetical protein [Streptomyces sp. NPDC088727]|uniref:hypothetical protein n=1 Tax=Streptomyces sp. NPDC088727 TaxID=3365875 RepID=UPI0038167422
MKKASIQPYHLYAVLRADRFTVPALVLDNRLWDRLPGSTTSTFRPAPKKARWSTALNVDTGARRGVPVVLPRPGFEPTESTVQALENLAQAATDLSSGHEESIVLALRSLVEEPLVLDAIRESRIIMPWTTHLSGEHLHKCPTCGQPVAMNTAGMLRGHSDTNGSSCSRSNTPLTAAEKEALK